MQQNMRRIRTQLRILRMFLCNYVGYARKGFPCAAGGTRGPHPPQCAHWGTFPVRGEGFGRADQKEPRYLPVRLSGQAAICSGVPEATILPPRTPPPGPMSST